MVKIEPALYQPNLIQRLKRVNKVKLLNDGQTDEKKALRDMVYRKMAENESARTDKEEDDCQLQRNIERFNRGESLQQYENTDEYNKKTDHSSDKKVIDEISQDDHNNYLRKLMIEAYNQHNVLRSKKDWKLD